MSERRLVMAFDCDDVLVPTARDFIEGYNAAYGTNVEFANFYAPATVETWSTDDEELVKARVEEYMRSNPYKQAPPYPEAILAIQSFAKRHELHLVTGRSHEREPETLEMLDRYFPGYFNTVVHTNHFVLLDSGLQRRTKGEVCVDLGADVLVDDHLVHGQSAIEAGVQDVIIFGDYPWSATQSLLKGMRRARDWKATLKEVNYIAGR
jgi:hypothetical protein